MSKRGITNYLQVIVTDADYDILDNNSSIEAMLIALKADLSTIHFDTAEGDIPMQKEPKYEEELGEEDNDGSKELIPKMTWIGVGVDEYPTNGERESMVDLQGKTKNVFVWDKNSGLVDRLIAYKINKNRVNTGNAKELWNFEAVSTKDGNQSSKVILLEIPVVP